MSSTELLVEAAYAVGVGLVVGFEREHHRASADLAPGDVPRDKHPGAPPESPIGVRTFALLALAGWLAAFLGDRVPAVAPVVVVAVVALIGLQYVIVARLGHEIGLTTEAAAVVVTLLGMLVHVDRALAVPLTLATLLLLIAKPWMQDAVVRLRRLELTATIQLLVLVAIVLPLLPTAPADPWGAIPPRKVGIFVVLIAGVEYVGYITHRLLGPTRGVAVAGLLGGLTSSTAVTAAMARQARAAPDASAPAQLAVFLANAVMGVRVVVITAVLSPAVAWQLAGPLGAMVAVLVAAALWRALAIRRGGTTEVEHGALELRNPFAVVPALTWGAVLCAVMLLAHFATAYLGSHGLVLAAAASGLADVDAITLAASRQVVDGASGAEIAALSISVAVASNTVVKGSIAMMGGGRRFGLGVALAFGVAMVAGAAVAAVQWLA
ncbi:MAG: DUF4010 domain-containing protein [Kofleriaceae bacterium]|nr:DUF4010 domain-containing protein [Kofleriaceae bacterium]MCB9573934.1 DUF4010 domain-containing protein [Kofleriaceae bacterium]